MISVSFRNGVTDAALQGLEGLTQLRSLDLTGCRNVTDAGLAHLEGLAKLRTCAVGMSRCNRRWTCRPRKDD